MSHRIVTIGRYTALEAMRTRLPILVLVVIALLLGASLFVREMAVTDSVRFQIAFYAATMRFATVFVCALYTIASVSREFHDKAVEAALALDLPRSHYVLGKLGGFLTIAAVISAGAGIALLPLAGWQATLPWVTSLLVESAVIVALSLFCVFTFASLIPAASFVCAFYLLARAITAIRLISANPVADADALSHRVPSWLIEAIAVVVPPFDAWTRTEWLVDHAPSADGIASLAAHGALLLALFTAAAVFDLHRRNL